MTETTQKLSPIEERPLVTFALFAYNQEKFIREAVEGAFAQTYEPLEIILSDDCSTDRTFEIMQEMVAGYEGPHRILLNQNEINFGLCDHVNKVFEMADGRLIVVAAGDDVSESGRVDTVANFWIKTKSSAIYSCATKIDASGNKIGEWNLNVIYGAEPIKATDNPDGFNAPPFYGAGAAYDKKIFDFFGRLPNDIRNEDFNLAWRAFFLNGIGYISEKLLRYRKHDDNLSFWVKLENNNSLFKRIFYKKSNQMNLMKNLNHVAKYAKFKFNGKSIFEKRIRDIYSRSTSIVNFNPVLTAFKSKLKSLNLNNE